MLPLAIVYTSLSIIFGTLIIVDFMQNRHITWRFSGLSFKYSLGLFLMSLVSSLWVLWIDSDFDLFLKGMLGVILQLPLLYMYLSVGSRYAHRLELPGAVFWKRLSWYPFSKDTSGEDHTHIHDYKTQVGKMLFTTFSHPPFLEIESYKTETADNTDRRWWFKADSIALLCVAAAAIYTVLLFKYAKPQASELVQNLRESAFAEDEVETNALLMIIVFARLAIAEEIFFRHAVQNFVEWIFRGKPYAAIYAVLVSSFFWGVGHVGILTPEWVKLAQIFPFGIILGILYRKYGFEIVALIHSVFNVLMIFITPMFMNI